MNKTLFFLFVLVWAGIILHFSCQSALLENHQEASGIADRLFNFLKIREEIRGELLSAGGHVFEYFFLSVFLLGLVRSFNLRYPHFLACALAIFFGLVDEFIQGFVPGRISAVEDVMIDAIGAGLGIMAVSLHALVARHRFRFYT